LGKTDKKIRAGEEAKLSIEGSRRSLNLGTSWTTSQSKGTINLQRGDVVAVL